MKLAFLTKKPKEAKEPTQVSMKVIEFIFYTLIVVYWVSIFASF